MNFKDIYEEYKDLVLNLALQYVQQLEEAEEITQDVFVIIYQKIDRFRNDSSLKTWIYRITIHQSLDFLKKKKAQKRRFLNPLFRVDPDEMLKQTYNFNHPGVNLENKEALAHIFSQINRLTPNQKTVIILAKLEDLPLDEVAEIMKISQKAADSLLQRAKKKLQHFLNQSKDYI